MVAPCRLGVLCLVALAAEVCASKATPLSKVVEMLRAMHKDGVQAKEVEANKYSAFKMWCSDEDRIKSAEIEAAAEQVELLTAGIAKSTALIESLSARIEELDEDVGRWKKDRKATSSVREVEHADFTATLRDYSESVDAIARAVVVLRSQAKNRAQVEQALVQVARLPSLPVHAGPVLRAFLQESAEEAQVPEKVWLDASHGPEAYGYEFQSGGVVEMLLKLKTEFATKKSDLEKEGLTAKHAFEHLLQKLTDETENAEHEIAKKTLVRAETEQAKAQDEGDLAQVTADRAEDEKYLSEMQALCSAKAVAYESRTKLRAEELEAVQKGIDILTSEQLTSTSDKLRSSLLQKRALPHALAQILGGGGQQSPQQLRAAQFLSERARRSNSRLLSLVSQRVASDPFGKVRKMIKDLINKLLEEATAETEKKGWCDAELGTNKQTREHKTEEVQRLASAQEDLASQVEQLGQELTDLGDEIADLEAAMAKASKERSESKERNEQTLEEAKQAQTGVSQAIAVLQDFYTKTGEGAALVQQTPAEDAPETFSQPYQGMALEGGNVIAFLEVVLSDFARLEAETSSQEAAEVEELKTYMAEAEQDQALKETEVNHKQTRRADKESDLHATTEELKATQGQLDKAVAYFEKLKPTCVNTGVTFEERTRRREEEIQSLQEAVKMLNGVDMQ